MPDAHAKYGISSMYRLLNGCTAAPGAIARADITPTTSQAAERGTAGHWLVEEFRQGNFHESGTTAPNGFVTTHDLHEAADECYQILVDRKFDQVHIEKRVEVGHWLGTREDCWGTADVVGIRLRRDGKTLKEIEVMDHKFGHIDVAPTEPQPWLYLGGAFNMLRPLTDSRTRLRTTILQPASHTTDKTMLVPRRALEALRKRTLHAIEDATGPNPTFRPHEQSCRFCPIGGECRAQMAWAIERDFGKPAETLSDEELADILQMDEAIRKALEQARTQAMARLSAGRGVPGWKRVEGATHRRWIDEDATIEALKSYTNDLFSPPRIRHPAQIEKLLKGSNAPLSELIEKPEGRPTLAPEDDRRPALDADFDAV